MPPIPWVLASLPPLPALPPPPPYPPDVAFKVVGAAAFEAPIAVGVPTEVILETTRLRIVNLLSLNASNLVIRGVSADGVAVRRRSPTSVFEDVNTLDNTLSGSLNTSLCNRTDTGVVMMELSLHGTSKTEYDLFVAAIQDGTLDLTPDVNDDSNGTYVECVATTLLSVGGAVPAELSVDEDDNGLSTELLVAILSGSIIGGLLVIGMGMWWLFFRVSKRSPSTRADGTDTSTESGAGSAAGQGVHSSRVRYTVVDNRHKTDTFAGDWKISL